MNNPEAAPLEASHLPALARSIGRFGPMLGDPTEAAVLADLRDPQAVALTAQP